jgi:sialate O-acetylesterase
MFVLLRTLIFLDGDLAVLLRWKKLICLVALLVGAVAPELAAEVKLSTAFSDHAVLQRERPIVVWGTGADGDQVTVTLAGKTATATTKDGKWKVELPAMSAGGPHEMTVTGPGANIKLQDLLIGEVWLCGGQSNMQWSINQSETPADVKKMANLPQLRFINVARGGKPEPQTEIPRDEKSKSGYWQVAAGDNTGDLTAVGFHFGKHLLKELNVPIGLINSNVGGTPAQRWAAVEDLAEVPETKVYIKNIVDQKTMKQRPDNSDLYNAMIAPLANYSIRGAIWYQGESNAGQAERYRTLFPTMIKSWRRTFGQPELPFLFVQLAPYKTKTTEPVEADWAELREAQLMTLSKLKNTGMAVITDLGNEKNIHPLPKAPVGDRLALAARGIAYGQKLEYSGPLFESMKVEGNKAMIKFAHVGGGLVCKGDKLTGWAIAGEDKKFVWADAKIEGDTVVVTSDKVTKPVAVRFGWANYPEVNLWNKADLPASPFRTDSWPGVTTGK